MNNSDLNRLLEVLVALPSETEWVEFKANFHSEEQLFLQFVSVPVIQPYHCF